MKKNGEKRVFDRDKIARSMTLALRKRHVDPEAVEQAINGIVKTLETSGEAEIESGKIGELVVEALRKLDHVAYIRYASVYRDFEEAADFNTIIKELGKK